MAIKISKEINDFVALISNVFETFTTAFFEFDANNNILRLNYCYSLSKHIEKNSTLFLGKHLKIWLLNFNKPLEFKNDKNYEYNLLLNIYKKKENIKTFFAVPVGDYEGLLYVDTKRSYAIPEKQQKVLVHCANIINHLLKIEKAAKDLKSLIDYSELAKKIKLEINKLDNCNVYYINKLIEVLSDFLGFEYGFLLQNNFDNSIKFLGTNLYSLEKFKGKVFDLDNNIAGSYFNNNIKIIRFIDNPALDNHFFSNKENFNKDKIANYLYFPFINGDKVIAAFFFFNVKSKYDFYKLYNHIYDVLYPVIYEATIRIQIENLMKVEPISGFIRDYYFLNYIGTQNIGSDEIIFVKVKNFFKLLNRTSLKNILKSYRLLKSSFEKVLDNEITGGFFALNKLGFVYSNTNSTVLRTKKNIILKTFNYKSFNLDHQEINFDLEIEIFSNILEKKKEILKKIVEE